MKLISGYKKQQFLYLIVIFILFTVIVVFSEYHHEKHYRVDALKERLGRYTEIINNYSSNYIYFENRIKQCFDSITGILPDKNLRTTIIDFNGIVIYDSKVNNITAMENHLMRPEIQQAISDNTGTDIRVSATTGVKYFYFAKRFADYFIRLSVVYDIEARKIIEPDKLSIILIIILFFIASVSLVYVTDKFGKSVSALRKFTIQASADKTIDDNLVFPENELGNIGQDIVDIYHKLNKTKQELVSEKEKLIRHLTILEEGIAIFSKEKQVIINNGHFIQYLNQISDQLIYSAENFFGIKEFEPLHGFINKCVTGDINTSVPPSYEINIFKNSKYYSAKCIMYQDRTFEVIIKDTTKPAKQKLLKHQITENIAHELKTPVTSISGLLETVLNNNPDNPRNPEFIQRAYSQTCRLSELINDISLLTKIEEAGHLYQLEKVKLHQIISNVIDDFQIKIKENNINIALNIPDNIEFNGNPVLLYSVFRNLFENTVNYAGNNVYVSIDKYSEDSQSYYFSFSDNGPGVPEQDIPRLFERFYRVDKGRERKSGGTGLGLSIVKNAILFHKGDISVKNRKEGGLEFLFSINRNLIS